ncbi:MAG: hypothetical protein HYY01_03175 [Chloroflexi bacterium]|nr:hypothetical protein [Chloroflexota bacterium]
MSKLLRVAPGLASSIAIALWLMAPVMAQAPESVPVRGQLVNGTKDGPVPANVQVKLTEPTEEGQELAQTTTDAEGRYQFAEFAAQAGAKYKVTLNYQGADYQADWPPEDPAKGLAIIVYEATTDPSSISVKSWHILVQAGQGILDIDEFMVFENTSDRAYVGTQVVDDQGRKATLKFSVPKGAYGYQYMQGLMDCCMVPTASGIVDTMAVLPGTKEVFFHYFVDAKSGTYDLARLVDYPAADVRLLSQDIGPRVSSSLLANQGPVTDANGTKYLSLTAANLTPGSVVTASFTGVPTKGLQSNLRWLGVGVLVLAVGGVAVAYPVLRRRGRGREAEAESPTSTSERERLLFEVADLDNRYERGEVPEAEYQSRRKTLMDILVYLSEQEKGDDE